MCMGVKRWNSIAALLLLGLWAACSINCARENLSGAASLACCNDEGGDSDQSPASSSPCACRVLVSGAYVPYSQIWLVALPANAVFPAAAFFQPEAPVAPVGVAAIDSSPPELAGSWQFIVRTALPARAPSLVS